MSDGFRSFTAAQEKVRQVIEARKWTMPRKKQERYDKGEYNPFWCLVKRGGNELHCIWCGNRKKEKRNSAGKITQFGDIEIIRFQLHEGYRKKRTGFLEERQLRFDVEAPNNKREIDGLFTDSSEPLSWDNVTRLVMQHFPEWRQMPKEMPTSSPASQ